jgi:ketosteroid isomerase-like protein
MKGRDTFEKALRALLTTHRIESASKIQEIEVSGDLAYCWSELTVRVIPLSGGSSTARSGSALSILRKRSTGSWVVVRDANLLPAKS